MTIADRRPFLQRLGEFCARNHWPVIAVWIAIVVVVSVAGQRSDGEPRDVFVIPGAQSQKALDLLESQFPAAAGASATVVFQVDNGTLTDPTDRPAIDQVVANLKALPDVSYVTGPFDQTPTGIASFQDGKPVLQYALRNINQAATVGYASVQFSSNADALNDAKPIFRSIQTAVAPAVAAGIAVSEGGQVVDSGNPPDPGISQYSEPIGLLFAVIILLFALGSVTSAAIPIAIALTSVAMSHNIVNILEGHFTIGTVAPVLGSMIGLGVGIDYSLFVLSRHREGLRNGSAPTASVGMAMATAGSAVLFAGLTVCLALCGLYFVGIPYLAQLGYIAALFVVVTMAAAMTLLPALLGALGRRVTALAIHHRDEGARAHETLSARWANATSHHPLRYAVLSLVVLVALAAPVFRIDLGFTDDGNLPADLTQRKAYDTITANFGAGINGPLLLAIDLRGLDLSSPTTVAAGFSALSDLTHALQNTPGVASVSVPIPNSIPTAQNPTLPTALIMQVVPTTGPNAGATSSLVRELRTTVVPNALRGDVGAASRVYVGGTTATLIDLTDALKSRLALFIGAVIVGAFVLLLLVFRSLFVPFKAAVMNVLSIGAAYGVIVAIFQWGWGKGVIGLSTTVPIVAFVPVMMFAVLFGLSMDYEVFLLTRIKEEYAKTGSSRQSVVSGLAHTARVISAAALIMISVFLSFVPNPAPTVKMIGLGMAVAVLVDATIVRMMLVPSTMELAGKANWWLPRWLDRILPHIHLDEEPVPAPARDPEPVAAD